MSARLSRRTLLASTAALPTLALLGCEYDRTTADPITTVDTLDFANRLRIPPWLSLRSMPTVSASSS